jgi:indolepyruvate ferredoxin oxidoreductase alpha subunit
MGEIVSKVSIEAILRGIGLSFVETVDPFDHTLAVDTVQRAAKEPGVKAIIFRSPCIALPAVRKNASLPLIIDPEKCIGCQRCIREIGCPALLLKDGKAAIDPAQCTGCSLCQQLCRFGAISKGGAHV